MKPWRRRTVKGLIVLGSLLAFLSVFAIWVERQALDTGEWVHTSGNLIRNATIRTAVGDYLVEQLYENVNVEKELEGILPGDTKELAGPAAGGLRQVAGTGAEKVLETGTAQSLWETANRTAHEQLMAVLENKKEAVSTANGEVKLNLGSMLTNLAGQIGLGKSLAEQLPPDAGQITILKSEQLKTAQDIVIAIKGLALLLSILTFLVFGLAIYLTQGGRWVTVLFSGIGLIVAGLLVMVLRHVAGGVVVDQLVKQESVKPAAEAAWSIGTSLMVSIATTVIIVGAFFAAAGWLSSPTGSARGTRRVLAPALDRYLPYCYGGLAVILGIYLLTASGVGLRTFLTVVVIGVMAAFGLRELSKQTAEEFPGLTYGEVLAPTRKAIATAVSDANLGERASKIKLPEVKRPSGMSLPDVRRGGGHGPRERGPGPARGSHGEGAPAAPGPEAPTRVMSEEDARLTRLERLATLHEKGILSDEEFAAEKARLLRD
ncbi:MAG TPA: SHOCT domain-containing protein [Solirubrobacterales bacterium]|nr:SHOCT domain-containing protein [Solirubrobacterales bacterium]